VLPTARSAAATPRSLARSLPDARDIADELRVGLPSGGTLRSARFDSLLQLSGAGADKHVADHAHDRAANERSEHAAEVDLDRVGGTRAAVAEILELPAAVDRLEVAFS